MIHKRNLSILVIATFILTFISTSIATPAQGKSKRVAVITELKGSATVKNAGGSREYDAYPDMGLNQGDYITTDRNSSVKVVIKDRQDEFTIGANAVVSISILADTGKDKKSKLKLFSGSVWSNVNKLSGGDDYEVETPTAVMAVRGTKVLTSVNGETGETYVAVAAGTVSAKTNNQSTTNKTDNNSNTKNNVVLIAPSQQFTLDSRTELADLENKVSIIDTKKLVTETSKEIIEAMVKDKKDIDRENAEFIAAQKQKIAKGENTVISRGDADSSLNTIDQAELDKVTKNLDNLIGNVVKTAIEEKKVDKDTINKVIEETNKNITDPNKKLDLDKLVPLDKTAGVDVSLQKAKDEELKKLEAIRKANVEAKKKEDDAEKAKLAEALKLLEAEKARIEKAKEDLGLIKSTPTPAPTASPTPSPTVTNAPDSTPTPTPFVTAALSIDSNKAIPTNTIFDLNVAIKNITGLDQVYGVEVHVVYDKDLKLKISTSTGLTLPPPSPPSSDFFNSPKSEIRYGPIYIGTLQSDIIYAAVLPVGNVTGDKLVKIPLMYESSTSTTHKNNIYVYIRVVSKDGTVLINKMSLDPALSTYFTSLN